MVPRETGALKKELRLVLPYAISGNRYWRSFVPRGHSRAIVCLSDEAKAYKRQVGWIAREAGLGAPTELPLELTFTLCPRTNKDGSASAVVLDLTNALKVAEDALQGIVYVNDRQVKALHAAYGEPMPEGALVVEIREFVPTPAPLFAQEVAA